MTSESSTPQLGWSALFKGSPEFSETRSMAVLSRRGHSFLYLPYDAKASRHAMQLYPAQTHMARAACAFISAALRFRLLFTFPHRSLQLDADTSFANFLITSARTVALSQFAVLVGNPNSPGTRFIFLLFNDGNAPACVVKAGTTPIARELVRREFDFLRQYSSLFPSLVSPLGYSETDDYAALALPFIAGNSPRQDDGKGVAQLLESWISHDDPIPLCSIPAWQNLPQNDETFRKIDCLLAGQMVRPVLMHGDFAPWNIKVAKDGSYAALDWERGEFPGVPAWDWFHYVVQTSILVRKESPKKTLVRLHSLLASRDFQTYAALTGIRSHEYSLLLTYLLHARQFRQTEGSPELEALLATLVS